MSGSLKVFLWFGQRDDQNWGSKNHLKLIFWFIVADLDTRIAKVKRHNRIVIISIKWIQTKCYKQYYNSPQYKRLLWCWPLQLQTSKQSRYNIILYYLIYYSDMYIKRIITQCFNKGLYVTLYLNSHLLELVLQTITHGFRIIINMNILWYCFMFCIFVYLLSPRFQTYTVLTFSIHF